MKISIICLPLFLHLKYNFAIVQRHRFETNLRNQMDSPRHRFIIHRDALCPTSHILVTPPVFLYVMHLSRLKRRLISNYSVPVEPSNASRCTYLPLVDSERHAKGNLNRHYRSFTALEEGIIRMQPWTGYFVFISLGVSSRSSTSV